MSVLRDINGKRIRNVKPMGKQLDIMDCGIREHSNWSTYDANFGFMRSLGTNIMIDNGGTKGNGFISFKMRKTWVRENSLRLSFNMQTSAFSSNDGISMERLIWDGDYDYRSLDIYPDHKGVQPQGSGIFGGAAYTGDFRIKKTYVLDLTTADFYTDGLLTTAGHFWDWDGYEKTFDDFTSDIITVTIGMLSGQLYSRKMTFDTIKFISGNNLEVLWQLNTLWPMTDGTNWDTIHDYASFQLPSLPDNRYRTLLTFPKENILPQSKHQYLFEDDLIDTVSGQDIIQIGTNLQFGDHDDKRCLLAQNLILHTDLLFSPAFPDYFTKRHPFCIKFWFKTDMPFGYGKQYAPLLQVVDSNLNNLVTISIYNSSPWNYQPNNRYMNVDLWYRTTGYGGNFGRIKNVWQMLVFGYDGNTIYGYLDVDTYFTIPYTTWYDPLSQNLMLYVLTYAVQFMGEQHTPYIGLFDDLEIYDRMPTLEEISQLYNSNPKMGRVIL